MIAKARLRLLELVEPSLAALMRALRESKPCPVCNQSAHDRDPVTLSAAKAVLDRIGLAKESKLNVNVSVEQKTDSSWLAALDASEKSQLLDLWKQIHAIQAMGKARGAGHVVTVQALNVAPRAATPEGDDAS